MHTMMQRSVVRAEQLRRQLRTQRRKVKQALLERKLAVQKCNSGLALAMVSSDRQGELRSIASIQSLRAAGFNEPLHIFLQGTRASVHELEACSTQVKVHPVAGIGLYNNWVTAANWLLNNTNADWLMLMQDDIEWCLSGARVLRTTFNAIDNGTATPAKDLIGVLSPYTSPAMVAPRATKGWNEARFYGNACGLWGALVLCFTRDSLQLLLQSARFKSHTLQRALDFIIGDTFRNHTVPRRAVQIHVPSLIQHTGDNSTLFAAARVNNVHLRRLRRGYQYDRNYIPNY